MAGYLLPDRVFYFFKTGKKGKEQEILEVRSNLYHFLGTPRWRFLEIAI